MQKRFQAHHRTIEFLQAGLDTQVSWFEINKNLLNQTETILIDLLDPEINPCDVTENHSKCLEEAIALLEERGLLGEL